MTQEEMILQAIEKALAARDTFWNDLIKIGIPALAGFAAAYLTFKQTIRNKDIDERIAAAERNLKREIHEDSFIDQSRMSLIDRKRQHVESAAEDFSKFSNVMARFRLYVVSFAEKQQDNKHIDLTEKEKFDELYSKSYYSFEDANRAKKLIQLCGFWKTAEESELVIDRAAAVRRFAIAHRDAGRPYPLNEAKELSSNMRECSTKFLKSLHNDFESLVIIEEETIKEK